MLDFVRIGEKTSKNGVVEVTPKFKVEPSEDLMTRGGDFYAIWDEENGLWSTSETTAIHLIDKEVLEVADKRKSSSDANVKAFLLSDGDSGMVDKFHKYVQKQLRNSYHSLDEKLIFSNQETTKEDYATKRLPYPLQSMETPAYDELISTIYDEPERRKIEWAIGSVIAGDSKDIQKFLVFYGDAGTGKSTVLHIVEQLFEGYWVAFDAESIGNKSASFALEQLRSNPLIAIQHDGDLSGINNNARLNSLVSHETMTVNEKYKASYPSRFNAMLFIGTNKPVYITDAKSGIIRRLIDISPSGKKVSMAKYKSLTHKIKFELPGIAQHCLDIYNEDPGYYDDYIPVNMIGASNDFYNFILDNYIDFKRDDHTTLKDAYTLYKAYCDSSSLRPYSKTRFKEELKNYFREFQERGNDDSRSWNYYSGFITDKFETKPRKKKKESNMLEMNSTKSLLDAELAYCPAQYASISETPIQPWDEVKLKLNDILTTELHYVKVPENHIVIDFDIRNADGEKDFNLNCEAAAKWPPTYAELSKSGKGIHLHYIYDGDPKQLSRIYDENIEIKVFSGNQSLRRKLTKCNTLPIAHISSGLPLREKKMINFEGFKNEKALRTCIAQNLQKKNAPSTKCSIDFIFNNLQQAYESGMHYDVSDMQGDIVAFAAHSTHQSKYCLAKVAEMKFHSDEPSENVDIPGEDELVFFDCEVMPNHFGICYAIGDGDVIKLPYPTPKDISFLFGKKLVGFNCRRYDNHILYGRLLGYSDEQLFKLSGSIIAGNKNSFFGEAYNASYTDIYDFSTVKQSLKKFEIELGMHHQECPYQWDKPVTDEQWEEVMDYCVNDVLATRATFYARSGDWRARQILVDICQQLGMSACVNDTTNSLTTKIIFRGNKSPELVYTDLSETFPGYEFVDGKNMYRGENVGFGGYVYAEPGMYRNVALLDVASLHPHSITAMNCFGDYTQNFKDLMDARIYIKHKDFDSAKALFNGALTPYLDDPSIAKELSQALKIAINSVYGLTSASFDNPFRDPRNVNNIVALRGALFMVNLKHEVQERGFTVAHIKTDSIKIPDATPEIIDFCMKYAEQYGYTFEHEATYDRICLVNDAVYIAKDSADGHWTATGTQFQVPYVFKTLFSHEPLEFKDLCETKSVTTALYLDMNENLPEGEHDYRFVGKVGLFCPIMPGRGGGLLMREKDGKYNAAGGTKGYRWLEAEMVERIGKQDDIDISYYRALADKAIEAISEYGDFEVFAD